MPHSPTDSTSTSTTKSSRDNSRHPKSWPSTTTPNSASSTSSLSSLSSSTTNSEKTPLPDATDDATALLDPTLEKAAPQGDQNPITNPARKRDSTAKKPSKRHCIDFDWSYKNVYTAAAASSSATAAGGGRKVVSGSALGGRSGCGLM